MTLQHTSKNYNGIDFEDLEEIREVRNLKRPRQLKNSKPKEQQPISKPLKLTLADEAMRFTYHASRYEKQWIMDSLEEFYEQKWFEDILSLVKGGKEASVYLCKAPTGMDKPLLAAKVYRPRRFRNLKKDHIYREGRDQLDADGKIILDDRSHHAMQKKTTFGLELLHSSWVGHEFRTMKILSKAGVDLPKPYASSDNAIMMDYIGDEAGAAPTLNTVTLTSTEARQLFDRVLHNVEIMLQCNRVHADLSAYNILYWEGNITLIDFPQAINPDENNSAYKIFCRDLRRVCEYFASQGVSTDPAVLAERLWKMKGRRIKPELDPHYLNPDAVDDRWDWDNRED